MKPSCTFLVSAFAAAAAWASSASAQQYVIQPLTEADSKDAKIYVNSPGDSLQSDMAVSSRNIGFSSLLQFDLSSLTAVNANEIVSATMRLYVAGVTSASAPGALGGTVQVRPILSPWRETATSPGDAPIATYEAFYGIVPLIEKGGVVTSVTISTTGFIDFDITALVRQWKSGELENNGIFLQTPDDPTNADTVPDSNGFVRFADVDYSPTVTGSSPSLTVVVPEPSSALLLGTAGVALALRRRRA